MLVLVFNIVFVLVCLAAFFFLAWPRRQAAKTPPPITPKAPQVIVIKASPSEKKMMGAVAPGDEKIAIPTRDLQALKLALWRSREGWEIAWRQAEDIIGRCRHLPHCPGEKTETETCEPGCPDREFRLSALVVLNAARRFAPIEARRLMNAPYFAPSRERWSEILTQMTADQAELEAYRAKDKMWAPENETSAPPPQKPTGPFALPEGTPEEETVQ